MTTLSHTPPPVVENFYQNSFKQLSMVQQRQVGLLVGVAVADAAARPLDGCSEREVGAYLSTRQHEADRVATAQSSSTAAAAAAVADDSLLAFARVRPREIKLRDVGGCRASASSVGLSTTPHLRERAGASLRVHSFTYQLYYEMLRAMSSARGEFAVDYVRERLIGAATVVDEQHTFAAEHASLLHTLCTLLPTPAIYPYASDAAVRRYLDPFMDLLTESPADPQHLRDASAEATEAAAAERAAVRDYTVSTLGVVLRQLQSNPDATRNAAFMAVPGTAAVFPADVQAFTPPLTSAAASPTRVRLWDVQRRLASTATATASSSGARWLPRRCTAVDAVVVREGFEIARRSSTFTSGVAQAIRHGGPTCQRAMLVGALLGARLGVRAIPAEWLSATADHRPVATMALEVAQWSWNPPHR